MEKKFYAGMRLPEILFAAVIVIGGIVILILR